MVSDHHHVDMLVECVDGVGHGRVRRTRQKVRLAHNLQNIGRMTAASAFGVKRTHYGLWWQRWCV